MTQAKEVEEAQATPAAEFPRKELPSALLSSNNGLGVITASLFPFPMSYRLCKVTLDALCVTHRADHQVIDPLRVSESQTIFWKLVKQCQTATNSPRGTMTEETRVAETFSNVPPWSQQHRLFRGTFLETQPSATWKRRNRGAKSQRSSQPNHPNRSRLWCSLILEILFPR